MKHKFIPFAYSLAALMLMAACTHRYEDASWDEWSICTLSPTEGVAGQAFVSHIEVSAGGGPWEFERIDAVEGLPPELTFREATQTIEGDSPKAGLWKIRVKYRCHYYGMDGESTLYYYSDFDLRMHAAE